MRRGADGTHVDTFDEHLVSAALNAVGARFSTAVILFDAELRIAWASPATSAVLGLSEAMLGGRSALDLVHPDDVEVILPMVAPVLDDPGQMLLTPTGARTVELPIRVRSEDGTWRWVAAAGRVIDGDGHLVVTVRPGDERHALDRVIELLGRGDQLADVLDALVDLTCAHFDQGHAAFVHDFDGPVVVAGAEEVVADLDPVVLLDSARACPSGGIVHDEHRWFCSVLNGNRESVIGVLVLPSPRPSGPTRYDETVMERVTSLAAVAHERAAADRMLRRDASTDHLTGVLNRRSFERRLMGLAVEEVYPVTVLFVDVDHFKEINDRFGHAIGDDVLIAVAGRVGERTRPGDFVGRLGGDEFVVACPRLLAGEIELLADRIRTHVESPVDSAGRRVEVRVSIGIAVADDDDELLTVVERSDSSMYRDKHERRRRSAALGSW